MDDVDAAFDESRMITLRYAEPRRLHGRGSAITVTPLAAGHMVGGTIWKINKETEEIVYAVDFNHKTERHLGGTAHYEPRHENSDPSRRSPERGANHPPEKNMS